MGVSALTKRVREQSLLPFPCENSEKTAICKPGRVFFLGMDHLGLGLPGSGKSMSAIKPA